MKKFLLIILVLCAFVTIRCSREKSVPAPVEPVVPVTEVYGNQSGTWSGIIRLKPAMNASHKPRITRFTVLLMT